MTRETGFGNVTSRSCRYDLYLRNEGACNEALNSMFSAHDTELNKLFTSLFDGNDSEFHELSALICDKGAESQLIHPDTIFTTDGNNMQM